MSDTLTEMQREIEGLKRQLRQFASGQYSGVWTAYTPTPTNFTLGNGTMVAKYAKNNGLIAIDLLITLGTTSVMGTFPQFSLPVSPINTGSWNIQLRETGVSNFIGYGDASANGNLYILRLGVSGENVLYTGITATVPFTWADGDQIKVFGIYGG